MSELEFHPLTADRWGDLVTLFEHHGNPGYCWCMIWRLPSSAYRQLDSSQRRQALQTLVDAGTPAGVLAYLDGEPVGWCSVAPRETYQRLERSKTLKRIDELVTWSVVCFYLNRKLRHQGLAVKLLSAGVDYAVSQGAEVVEGYPVERHKDEQGIWQPIVSYRFMGSVSTYEKAGFRQAGVASQGRCIMRYLTSAPEPGSSGVDA
jgi:GNAT superfamily N-acetyltransferase